ncbi:MAG TPA: hypothetical protein PL106_07330 [Flavobacteriales bacterium]|nr:hypothetical protein [Flavobacteriales bacterium]
MLLRTSIGLLATSLLLALPGCKGGAKTTTSAGPKVEMPFTGNKYESNNRFFRGTGTGVSVKQNIARSKSDLEAKQQLAAQVGTNVRAVTDQYLGQTENAQAADVADKFQSLVREVMDTQIGDLRKIGEEVRQNQTTQEYTVYTAYEIKKNAMFRFLKKQAQTNQKLDDAARKRIEEILDEEIKKADLEDRD